MWQAPASLSGRSLWLEVWLGNLFWCHHSHILTDLKSRRLLQCWLNLDAPSTCCTEDSGAARHRKLYPSSSSCASLVVLLVGGDGKYSQSSKIRSSLITAHCRCCHPVIKWRHSFGVMSWWLGQSGCHACTWVPPVAEERTNLFRHPTPLHLSLWRQEALSAPGSATCKAGGPVAFQLQHKISVVWSTRLLCPQCGVQLWAVLCTSSGNRKWREGEKGKKNLLLLR